MMNPMNLNPLWAPVRRLPRVPPTPPPAYTEHGNHAGPESLPRRFYSTMLPFRTRMNYDSYTTNDGSALPHYPDFSGYPPAPRSSRRHSISEHGSHSNSSGSNSSYELGSVAPSRSSRKSHRSTTHRSSPRARSASTHASSQCDVGDCRRDPTPGARYCREHVCRTQDCDNIRSLGSRYCADHSCRLCENRAAEPGTRYCVAHKCIVANCYRCRGDDSPHWCRRHACRWEKCARPTVEGDNARYCADHLCIASGCRSRVLYTISGYNGEAELGRYCCCHSCSEETCLRAVSRGAFCAEHECKTPGCPNPRRWDDERGVDRKHECCKFHTCVHSECFAPTAQGHIGGLCDFHAQKDEGLRDRNSSGGRSKHRAGMDHGHGHGHGHDDSCSTRHRCCRARERERDRRGSRRKSASCRKDDDLSAEAQGGSEHYRSLTIRIVRIAR